MNKTRQDAWTKNEDIILAEIILRYIREGKTQLEAFKEAAERLSRTAAACGFRWNATLRRQYNDAIISAKNQRKQFNQEKEIKHTKENEKEMLDSAILLLEKMKNNFSEEQKSNLNDDEVMIIQLKTENERLTKQLMRYHEAWGEMKNLWDWIEDDNEK